MTARGPRVLIVGAGFGGIAAAVELRRAGFSDVEILDAADAIGGTWLLNSYPGAACDVPSPFYSFSWAKRSNWKHLCAEQPDILEYLQSEAVRQDVAHLVTLGTRVQAAEWDARTAQWTVSAADGRTWQGDVLIVATGQLNQPKTLPLPGLDTFGGHVFHSARWDHDYDLTGKRVAVIGNGPSAVQFVPTVARQAARLSVFQRSANWILPRRNRPYPAAIRNGVQRVPGVQDARRAFWFYYCELLTFCIRHPKLMGPPMEARSKAFMRLQMRHGSKDLIAKATPDYRFGCKRIVFTSHFLPALTRPNVELVTDAITGVEPAGIRTSDGTLHEIDCLIWGTGFASNDFMFPMELFGRDGLSLRQVWADGAHAHLGMTVPGFPSMFVLYGPNTNTSGGSIVWYLEQQVKYVRQALELLRSTGSAALEVRADVEASSDAALQSLFAGTAWTAGCDSWYQDPNGRNVANWPGYMTQYRKAVRELHADEFDLIPRPAMAPATSSAG
ncbi:MAG: flavin-containing monooxygenase [Sporichthyaceae bacterium]